MPGHWTAAGSRYWAINQPWKLLGWFEDPFQTELSFSSRYPPMLCRCRYGTSIWIGEMF